MLLLELPIAELFQNKVRELFSYSLLAPAGSLWGSTAAAAAAGAGAVSRGVVLRAILGGLGKG